MADEKGFPHGGILDFADNKLDRTTGTLRVRGDFKNNNEYLTPGLFVRVRIPFGDPHEALLVPERASSATRPTNSCWWWSAKIKETDKGEPEHRGVPQVKNRYIAGRLAGDRFGPRPRRPGDGRGTAIRPAGQHRRCRSGGKSRQPATAVKTAQTRRRLDPRRTRVGLPAMFSRFFIDRPILASVPSIMITLLGLVAVFTLPVAQYPEITPPTIRVTCVYPGASAQVVADTVAAPIEQQVNGVEDMFSMSSQSSNDGTYQLTVTFKVGTDLNMAQVLVQNRVALAMPILPTSSSRSA